MRVAHQIRMAGLGLLIVTADSALAAQDPVLRIAQADCARLVRHQPAPDVAYQPGIELRGREVVPADLEGGVSVEAPRHFLVPIEIDLADRLGIPASPDNFQADAFIGVIEVRGKRAYFNGQPLQNEAEVELATICQEVAGQAP